jgi:hypothetical protein
VNAPAVIIRLELEARPKLIADYLDDGEAVRMDEWLSQHPAYRQLVDDALRLAETERAA